MTTRTVHDPFTGKDVQVSNRLTDRLRGKYAVGPVMPNGEPEFGWRQNDTPPIQHEAAAHIEALEAALTQTSDLAQALCVACRSEVPNKQFLNWAHDKIGVKILNIFNATLAPEQDK